ncbi:MAG: uroporphyrinogen decarboxylase family protein [Planctomycetota bacterium]
MRTCESARKSKADLFTRPCILRNMENVMLDMIERPEMAHYLFDKFTAFYSEDITRALEATGGGFDIYCEWSDYGTQRALLISVPMFREFLAPYLKRMIDVCHSAGVKFMAHSCGAIRPLIPDLTGLAVDILDPIQVAAEGMEPAAATSSPPATTSAPIRPLKTSLPCTTRRCAASLDRRTIDRTRHVDISSHALIGRLSWEFMVRSRPCCRPPR